MADFLKSMVHSSSKEFVQRKMFSSAAIEEMKRKSLTIDRKERSGWAAAKRWQSAKGALFETSARARRFGA
jgi:hypothetical protein